MLNYGSPSAETVLRATLASVLSSKFNRCLAAAKGSHGWRRGEYLSEAQEVLSKLVENDPAKGVEKTLELATELSIEEHIAAIQREVARLIRNR